MKRILVVAAVGCAVLIGWVATRRAAPPEVPFSRAVRQTLSSSIPTNGKVEPLEAAIVRSQREGTVAKVHVEEGQVVSAGALLVELDARDAQVDLAAAQARITEARAQLETVERGGRSAELAEVESGLGSARQARRIAQQDYATEQRLLERQATTQQAVNLARDQVERTELQIQALERRRGALVSSADRTTAEARIGEAQAAAALAQHRIDLALIRAPIGGVVYQLRPDGPPNTELKVGAYLRPGDVVARIGELDRMRVRVYVDEPELGRVSTGMAVNVAWAAKPRQQWKGEVDKLPSEVVPLGTRQVGEVMVTIDNPGHELLPGTNIDAEIISQVVPGALTIPKEALRREAGEDAVYRLDVDHSTIELRRIKLGAISIARAEVVSGLKEGDSVALPVERLLKPGDKVTPVYP